MQRYEDYPYIERLLQGYSAALDCRDPSLGYSELWRVFEGLLSDDIENYDTIIKRAINVGHPDDGDRTAAQAELRHLRFARNLLVHEGVADTRLEIAIQQLKVWIHRCLLFVAKNSRHFRTLRDVRDFLSQSQDYSRLVTLRRNSELALRWSKRPPG